MISAEEVAALIGRRYSIGGDGPEVFDCYGLVRHVLNRAGLDELPAVERTTNDGGMTAKRVLRHPHRSLYRLVEVPRHLDVVLMGNVDGRDFHMGVFVHFDRVGQVLHAEEAGGVVCDPVVELDVVKGFYKIRFFRKGRPDDVARRQAPRHRS